MSGITLRIRSFDEDTVEQAADDLARSVLRTLKALYTIEESEWEGELSLSIYDSALEQPIRAWIASAFERGLIDMADLEVEDDSLPDDDDDWL